MSTTQWFWCLTHQQVEAGDQRDDPDNALGPYPTEDAARNWKATSEARNEAWDDEDERWNGDAKPAAP